MENSSSSSGLKRFLPPVLCVIGAALVLVLVVGGSGYVYFGVTTGVVLIASAIVLTEVAVGSGIAFACTISEYWRNWTAFFLLGTINNLAYVVVGSSAQYIAVDFNDRDDLGIVIWANIFFGLFARMFNTFFLDGMSFSARIYGTAICTICGLVGLSCSYMLPFADTTNFWFAIGAIAFVGAASSFGESVFLAYLKGFDSSLVDGWSSGTGMAGVLGSLLYLGLHGAGISNQIVFLVLIPFVFAYVLVFTFLLKEEAAKIEVVADSSKEALLDDEYSVQEGGRSSEPTYGRYLRCFKAVLFLSSQLGLVYFFEYVISSGAADLANPVYCDNATNVSFVERNAFAILAFNYQLGVLISRSSLKFVKISRVELLTIAQGLFFVLWLANAQWHFLNVWFQFGLMTLVGLLGGASYVNVFYLLLQADHIPDEDRELCINFAAIFQTLGITAASLFDVGMDKTVFYSQTQLPCVKMG